MVRKSPIRRRTMGCAFFIPSSRRFTCVSKSQNKDRTTTRVVPAHVATDAGEQLPQGVCTHGRHYCIHRWCRHLSCTCRRGIGCVAHAVVLKKPNLPKNKTSPQTDKKKWRPLAPLLFHMLMRSVPLRLAYRATCERHPQPSATNQKSTKES